MVKLQTILLSIYLAVFISQIHAQGPLGKLRTNITELQYKVTELQNKHNPALTLQFKKFLLLIIKTVDG